MSENPFKNDYVGKEPAPGGGVNKTYNETINRPNAEALEARRKKYLNESIARVFKTYSKKDQDIISRFRAIGATPAFETFLADIKNDLSVQHGSEQIRNPETSSEVTEQINFEKELDATYPDEWVRYHVSNFVNELSNK